MAAITKLSSTEMQKIKSWEDLRPFAGKIVALQTSSSYFGNGDESYRFPNIPAIFASVSSRPCQVNTPLVDSRDAYQLYNLVRTGEKGGGAIADNYSIQKCGPLSLRQATPDELQ